MYLSLEQITTIQLDHTSRCNLRCPQCARTAKDGSVKPSLPAGRDLTVEDYRIILEPFRSREIKLFHCGNYGDAIASPTFEATLDFCQSYAPKARYTIITNGSLRTANWWRDLAKRLSVHSQNKVCFSIDGLSDTNGIYRVGSSFEKVIENLSSFIQGGGRARWDYLVFEHNKHQVEEARNLAEKLGVAEFNVKMTSRFISTETDVHNKKIENKKTKISDLEKNKNIDNFNKIIKQYSSFKDYAANTPITCKYQKQTSIFIDFDTRLWPCCWMGAPVFINDDSDIQKQHIQKVLNKYGPEFNMLRIHGWDILNQDYFANHIERSWARDFSDPENPRNFTCGRTCGEKYEFSSGYGENKKLNVL